MFWIICIFLFLPGSVISRPRCGGIYTAARGTITSPNFPNKFPTPIHCEWIIDAQHLSTPNSSIIVYFTQLFVFEGLAFKEYQIYDQTYQLNGRDIHTVSENNVTAVSFVQSRRDYLVISLKLDQIESTHLRVLDHFLDVYGFNITYEISADQPREDRCTMMDCGFTGNCYDHYTRFSCDCFQGYEGPKCSQGPNSLCRADTCRNGGTCVHLGDSTVRCECQNGFVGEFCENQNVPQEKECIECFASCEFDGREENVCKCPTGSAPPPVPDSVVFSFSLKLMNLPKTKSSQRVYIENYIGKLVRDAVPNIAETRIDQFQSFGDHVEVTCLARGARRDERRLRALTDKWADRGHIGNLSLVSQHAITLSLQNASSPRHQEISVYPGGMIHANENAVLSCRSPSPSSSFRWFKDGVFVNVTAPTSNKWEKVMEDSENPGNYVSHLGINKTSPFDQGVFTCQVLDGGMQNCVSRRVNVLTPPRVWIEPMSLTVRKGENFRIKCFSVSNDKQRTKYTYSWTKNKELLPIKTETEHYEVLYPMGSILQVSSINKSTSFSCLVQDSAVWAEQSILVDVIDSELIKTCPGEKKLKLLWPETAPGTESLQECPAGYAGVARRACTLRDTGQPTWYLPDFAACTANSLLRLDNQFQKIGLGYGSGDPLSILAGYKSYVENEKIALLPGEGSRILHLVYDVISYINHSISAEIRNTVLHIVDHILQRKNSLINQTQVILLQQVVKGQSLIFRSTFHRALSTIDVTLTYPDKMSFHVPLPAKSYPSWFSYKLHLALPQHYFGPANKSATLAVVVYRNLSAFLPQRSAIRLKDGIEMDYEVISNIVASWLMFNGSETSGNLSDGIFTMEFIHPVKNSSQDSWKILCGVADYASYGYSWDTQSCLTRTLEPTRTRCLCPRGGTFAILLTMKPSFTEPETIPARQLVIVIGCTTCALLTALTSLLLSVYLFFRRSCLVFLKVQCSLSILASMLVFLYAIWDDISQDLYLTVMTLLESFLLTGMSSQLSNLLIIYSELVPLHRMKNIKQTVVLIITGAPMIAVFGNHIAHLTMNTRINCWWLQRGTLSFNIFAACGGIIVVLYSVLYYIVINKLAKINANYEKHSQPLQNRLKLLKRSAVIFCSIVLTIIFSVFHVNFPENVLHHYTFSFSSIASGLAIFFSYVVFSEVPIKRILITRLKESDSAEKPHGQETTSKHLKFFTKQKPEVANESAPYFCKTPADTSFTAEMGSTSFKTFSSANFSDNVTSQHDLQYYDGSPKHFQRDIVNSPDLLASKKFVELDLVASSIQQKPTETTSFYIQKKTVTTPSITITQVESEEKSCGDERERPEGEENFGGEVPVAKEGEGSSKVGDMDAVMDSITHDLDYLLNGSEYVEASQPIVSVGSLRRISKPPSAVFEQIIEEPEEECAKIPENITNISRTNC